MIREYTALKNIGLAGKVYTPGEIFCADFTQEQEERLLRLECIADERACVEEPTEKEESVNAALEIDGTDDIIAPTKKRRKKATA